MKQLLTSVLSIATMMIVVPTLHAGDVTVKGVHLCCGACVRDANAALSKVKGISNTNIDRNSKQIRFSAEDDKAASAAIKALANAGYGGSASSGDKPIPFPKPVEKDGKADSIKISGVHLCCGGCVKGAQKAVKGVKGVTQIDVDAKAKTVVLTGSQMSYEAVAKALLQGGFYGKISQ